MNNYMSPLDVYEYCYDHGVAKIPGNWMITANFKWREAFVNEQTTDGYPPLEIFENVFETAKTLQAARAKIGRPFNIHCWVRQIPHNKRAGSTARRSPHINGRAVDFDVTGLTPAQTRQKLLALKLPIRIEANTKTWVHIDIGNSYIKDYKWGIFYA